MALDPKAQAALALHRFGLGPGAGSIAAIASDPRGALLAEINSPDAARINDTALLTSADAARAALKFQQERRAQRQADRAARAAANQRPDMKAGDAPPSMQPNAGPPLPQRLYLAEAKARIHAALGAEIGFSERLAWFWSNHFCVSADKGGVRPICGAYEREAIRAHMLGRFGDMLLAVESHPAMLLYLDNARSIGPDSPAGHAGGKGLNENLAREILELHTLGVRTVYSQADVTHFADVITGWTIVPPRPELPHAGEFTFDPRMHEPAAEKVIDNTYPDTGFEQGRAVLQALARHPATAKHVATKLARHFVADDPPLALVDKLSKRFLDTQRNLKEMAKAMIAAPEAWAPEQAKIKRPGGWIGTALRATGETGEIGRIIQA